MKENAPARRPLILVSNRLPVSLERRENGYALEESAGGLATALSSMREEALLWIGWPGMAVPKADEPIVTERLADHRLAPIFL
ncbi:MAG: bifunctional alpha,alpha-trehalose-phosphate synthase (UDP-forming)/trehalose-phosphatase, partial [Sandaracinaceae bacterium]|nr:bifunctional alpha,alpha-trehalose-phosphate synthase (UDP-forming)/trehalose-phosphatase [Sandaracinaceae bacterium]